MRLTLETIKKLGGITLKPNGAQAKNLKFIASQYGNEIKANISAIDDEYLKGTLEHYKQIARNFNAFVGLWVNEGSLFIDISHNFYTLEDCLKFAKAHNQIAVYDATKEKVVTV